MKKQLVYLFNGHEIPEQLFYELMEYSEDNNLSFRVNETAEKMAVTNVFRIMRNFQIETKDFTIFLVDLFERKKFYFHKLCNNEKL